MKRIKLLYAFLILQTTTIQYGFTTTGDQVLTPITTITGTNGGTTTSIPTGCPKCQSCNATTNPIPSLQINLFDSNSSSVNTFTFTTNSDFTAANSMLIVQIFPPSNSITSTSVTNTTDDNSYAIMYTLKALDGSAIQKQLQYITPATKTTPEIDIMPIQKKTPTIPISISIGISTPSTTKNGTATVTQLLGDTPVSFLPSLSGKTLSTQQRISNGISPLSLKFYLNWDGTTLSATPISGMFDSSDDTTLTTSLTTGSSSSIKPSTGSALSQISITINSKTVATFSAITIPFTQSDLAQGMALNIHIFPQSTANLTNPPPYTVITTLRSLDGLKLRKVVSQGISFNNQPSTFTISYGTNNTILSSTFANSSLSSGNAFNIISPINLRCLLHQNTASGTFMVSMV